MGSATRTAKHAEHGVSGQLILTARGEFEVPPIEYLVGPSFFGSSNQMGTGNQLKDQHQIEWREANRDINNSLFNILRSDPFF